MIKNRSSECLVLLYIITIDNFVKIGRLITFPCWIMIKAKQNTRHCVKSVQILGFFWPVFSHIRHFWLAFSFYTLWKHNEILNEKLIPYMNTIRALFFNFSVESNNQRGEKSKNQLSKAKTKKKSPIRDSMLNGIYDRGMNKDENIKVKIRKYPGASSIDILDHI